MNILGWFWAIFSHMLLNAVGIWFFEGENKEKHYRQKKTEFKNLLKHDGWLV